MISKETFIKIIDNIINQHKIDNDVSQSLSKISDGFCLLNIDNKIYISLQIILAEIFQDNDGWISKWLYEINFNKNKKMNAFYKNKKEIKIKNVEQLYDFLIKNMQ